MPNITVNLLDEAGTNQIASTTTDANGNFLFEDIAAGVYLAEFVPPANQRFAQANATTPDLDSDPDPDTGRVRVVVYDDRLDIDAGLYSNSAPQAASATAYAHTNTPTVGNVLSGATDADGDSLTAAVAAGPDHGTLVLNTDGSFTYTPEANWNGTDSFVFEVSDGYGGTDTATIDVVVASTLAPVGVTDTYTADYGHAVDAANGVLSNDTDQNNGTLRAVLARGPEYGELVLNEDGSFTYTPADDFMGTDSFTYRPTDDDGPGSETVVYLNVTDTSPEADDDEEQTDEDESVTLSVLDNDNDHDTLTVLGASDGLFGTTVVNLNGTITYTPYANFNGTDTFVYVIGDGSAGSRWPPRPSPSTR